MKKKTVLYGVVLLVSVLLILYIPVTEAEADSDFQITGNTLVKYTGTAETVSVPSTITTIGRSAFEGNTHIKEVNLSRFISEIEEYAFWGCSNLERVQLGNGISKMGDYTFANCTGLREIILPSSVSSIGISAFANCLNMTRIVIPPEVTDIHKSAFDGCVKLVIEYTPGSYAEEFAASFLKKQMEMPGYDASAVGGFLTEDNVVEDEQSGYEQSNNGNDGGASGSGTSSGGQPSSWEQIGGYESDSNMLGSVTVVGNRAVFFVDNTKIPVFEGNSSVDHIGIQPINITGDKLPKFAMIDQELIADQAYYGSREITILNIPGWVRDIGEFAFARSTIQQLNIPDGTENVSFGAFYHCDDLATVNLSETIMNVGPKAFSNTLWVEQFLMSGSSDSQESRASDFLISGGVLIAYRGNHDSPVIPEGVRVIAAEVFKGRNEIRAVSFPSSLRVIGEGAFEGCRNLSQMNGGINIIQIKDRAFSGCSLGTVEIWEAVEEIGLGAFSGAETVVFRGGRIPILTVEESSLRLTNDNYRKHALNDVLFAVINYDVDVEDIEDTVLHTLLVPFMGVIGSIGDDGKFYCRYSNLTEERIRQLDLPDTVSIHGNSYQVANKDRIQSLSIIDISQLLGGDLESETEGMPGTVDVIGNVIVTSPIENVSISWDETGNINKNYLLAIEALGPEESMPMDVAYRRIYAEGLPWDAFTYAIALIEVEFGVPIMRLGSREMSITMPVPEVLSGNDIQVLTLDRNGQLVRVDTTMTQEESGSFITFNLNYLSLFSIMINRN